MTSDLLIVTSDILIVTAAKMDAAFLTERSYILVDTSGKVYVSLSVLE